MSKRGRPPALAPEREWIRCRSCGFYRRRARSCPRCDEALPPACDCEALPGWSDTRSAGWRTVSVAQHRHLLHALLEARFVHGVEAADPWLEWLLSEAWWKHDEGRRAAPAADWREEPAVAEHFEEYPIVRNFATEGGAEALLAWAGLSEDEADVYMAWANGYTMAAIANRYGIRQVTAEQRFSRGGSRIQNALEFSLRGVAI